MAGAKKKLLGLFTAKVGQPISKNELAKTANVHDWARPIRTLRQEGFQVDLLPNGSYVLHSLVKRKDGKQRISIDGKTRYRILQRDHSVCQRCGLGVPDGVKLAIDHKIPIDMGGDGSDSNLWVLCEQCNLGKKHWFSDQNAEEMKLLFQESSGFKRLEMYLDKHPNELLEPSKLAVISGIRDWERTLRSIRQKTRRNIQYCKKGPDTGKEGYIYTK